MITRVLTAVGFFVLAGCQLTEAEQGANVVFSGEEITFRPLGEFDVVGAERYRGDSPSAQVARLNLLSRVMDRVETVHRIVFSSEAVHVKRHKLRAAWLDAEIPEEEAWFVDQLAASVVLEFANGDRTFQPDDDVVLASVERLIGRRSPNAALLAETLVRAERRIPAARLVTYAEQAAAFAAYWMENTCVECGRGANKFEREAMPHLHPNVIRIQTGVDELHGLVARLGR